MRWRFLLAIYVLLPISAARGQQSAASAPPEAQREISMEGMQMGSQSGPLLPSPHESSGTSWQPASVRGHEWMWTGGGWEMMSHGEIFIDYNQQGGPRGVGKAESVTSPHPGFPELFQTGETYHGEPLVDHQHPHNVFAELAAYYTLPISEKVTWELYGGPSAEPALGPVTYIHRASATEDPLAPLSHHLQDSTHTSFGVESCK